MEKAGVTKNEEEEKEVDRMGPEKKERARGTGKEVGIGENIIGRGIKPIGRSKRRAKRSRDGGRGRDKGWQC